MEWICLTNEVLFKSQETQKTLNILMLEGLFILKETELSSYSNPYISTAVKLTSISIFKLLLLFLLTLLSLLLVDKLLLENSILTFLQNNKLL